MSLIHEVSDIFNSKIYPERWQKVELNKIVKIQNGHAFKSSKFNSDYKGMPLIRIRDIKNSSSETFYDGEILEEYIVNKEDLLIGMDGDFNSNLWKGIPALLNQRVCRLFPNENIILKKFVYYGLPEFLNKINENTSSTTVKHLSSKSIGEIPFPLPPLAEQNRIVAKLDSIFAQLEIIKTSMVKIPVLLKNFRQQVLTQAVTGKLTVEWREGKELEEWNFIELDKFCKDSFYGPRFSKDDYTEEGLPTVRTTDMSDDGRIVLSNGIPKVKIEDPKRIELYKVNKGDLLITRTGSIGKMARYFENTIVIPSAYLIRFRFNDLALTDYVYYCLISPYGQNQMGLNAVAVTQPNLNAQKIKAIKIPDISIIEQQEIISRVESLFAKADAIEEKYKNLKAKIETLPQTILHKAFKGELSEQLETDGDARDLLEEIAALKNGGKAKKVAAKKYVQPDEILRIVAETDTKEYSTPVEKTAAWYDERFELWVSQQGLAARGSLDKDTLRELFDAMDDEDK